MMLKNTISIVLILLISGCGVLWLRTGRNRSVQQNMFGVLLLCALALEVLGFAMRLACMNSAWLYNGFQLLEFGLIMRMVDTTVPWLRRWTVLAGGLSTAGFIAFWVEDGGDGALLSDGILLLASVQLIFLLRALFHLADRPDHDLSRSPVFWVYGGMAVYFGGVVPALAGIMYVYTHDAVIASELWALIAFVGVLRYLLALVGLLNRQWTSSDGW
ncbi:MAG TPA: hypothetical protein PL070_09690 [Flavobacteriales bacterium]|nr:hypothetical protein [Flavobacteriales bacterium]